MLEIGELNEQPLHASLKAHYAAPDYPVEQQVDGYVIDVIKEGVLIEIQTGNFSSIRRKITDLVRNHHVRLVYPIAEQKWLYKLPKQGWEGPRRRKSPKKGRIVEVFRELVSFPELLNDKNFSLEIVLINEEEIRRYVAGSRRYNHGWVTVRRKLLNVVEQHVFCSPKSLSELLPSSLPSQFTTADLAHAGGMPRWLAQKMAYCLRKASVISLVGKLGRAYLYEKGGNDDN